MNWLSKIEKGCLMTAAALIASVTLLAGDKLVMAAPAPDPCTQCLNGCPGPQTAACVCTCANNQCSGQNITLACQSAGTADCDSTTCGTATWPCPPGCTTPPTGCPATAQCPCSCQLSGTKCGCF